MDDLLLSNALISFLLILLAGILWEIFCDLRQLTKAEKEKGRKKNPVLPGYGEGKYGEN